MRTMTHLSTTMDTRAVPSPGHHSTMTDSASLGGQMKKTTLTCPCKKGSCNARKKDGLINNTDSASLRGIEGQMKKKSQPDLSLRKRQLYHYDRKTLRPIELTYPWKLTRGAKRSSKWPPTQIVGNGIAN